jgi:hypothetical protein
MKASPSDLEWRLTTMETLTAICDDRTDLQIGSPKDRQSGLGGTCYQDRCQESLQEEADDTIKYGIEVAAVEQAYAIDKR